MFFYNRAQKITSDIVGLSVYVYSGKSFVKVFVKIDIIHHKLGEFVSTR